MKKQLLNDGWFFKPENGEEISVPLPHDAMQSAGRFPDAPSGDGGAFYVGGNYTYKRILALTEKESEGSVLVHFDGVYRSAKVYINDTLIAENVYGYLPFFADLTDHVRAGENELRVEAENIRQPNSRWYSGSGIYRSVHLWLGDKAHIEPEGIRIRTLGLAPARIKISASYTEGEISYEIFDGETFIASAQGKDAVLEIPDAKLWSDETPNLYRCRAVLSVGGRIVDEAETFFGIRTLKYDTTGFYVNGKRTMLRGGCIHHDNGVLGAVSVPEAEERKLTRLKDGGFNAIRSAHNPASTALLEACDRLGIYVMDEMWDMWYMRKTKFDYGVEFPEHWKNDIAAVVSRDYNHPSVILYSIGNENTEPHEPKGVQLAGELTARFHELDDSRPVTLGMNMALIAMSAAGKGLFDNVDAPPEKKPEIINSTMFNEMASRTSQMLNATALPEVNAVASSVMEKVDIVGYNYAAARYKLDASEHPGQVSVGSETYPYHLASTWKLLEECPYVIGDFMWTAVDYLGECGIGAWAHTSDAIGFKKPYPWKLGDTGAYDILLEPTGEALLARAVWKGETSLAVRPVPYPWEKLARGAWRGTNAIESWSWNGCEGMTAAVEVFTPGKSVSLYLNGELVETKDTSDMSVMFTLPYKPGFLKARAFDESGKLCGEAALETASGEVHWMIECESKLFFPLHS